MSRFLSTLIIRALCPREIVAAKNDHALYELQEDLSYESDLVGSITVPAGFVTDFASIPRPALWYIDDDDPGILFPSVIHDWIYSNLGKMPDGRTFTREQADQILREAMGISGARGDQRTAVYFAVRMGGASHWKNS